MYVVWCQYYGNIPIYDVYIANIRTVCVCIFRRARPPFQLLRRTEKNVTSWKISYYTYSLHIRLRVPSFVAQLYILLLSGTENDWINTTFTLVFLRSVLLVFLLLRYTINPTEHLKLQSLLDSSWWPQMSTYYLQRTYQMFIIII